MNSFLLQYQQCICSNNHICALIAYEQEIENREGGKNKDLNKSELLEKITNKDNENKTSSSVLRSLLPETRDVPDQEQQETYWWGYHVDHNYDHKEEEEHQYYYDHDNELWHYEEEEEDPSLKLYYGDDEERDESSRAQWSSPRANLTEEVHGNDTSIASDLPKISLSSSSSSTDTTATSTTTSTTTSFGTTSTTTILFSSRQEDNSDLTSHFEAKDNSKREERRGSKQGKSTEIIKTFTSEKRSINKDSRSNNTTPVRLIQNRALFATRAKVASKVTTEEDQQSKVININNKTTKTKKKNLSMIEKRNQEFALKRKNDIAKARALFLARRQQSSSTPPRNKIVTKKQQQFSHSVCVDADGSSDNNRKNSKHSASKNATSENQSNNNEEAQMEKQWSSIPHKHKKLSRWNQESLLMRQKDILKAIKDTGSKSVQELRLSPRSRMEIFLMQKKK